MHDCSSHFERHGDEEESRLCGAGAAINAVHVLLTDSCLVWATMTSYTHVRRRMEGGVKLSGEKAAALSL